MGTISKSERKLERKNVPDSGKEQPETEIIILAAMKASLAASTISNQCKNNDT